jgi:Leucine Rich repeat
MTSPPKKLKNWEELINDGQNYGDEGQDFSPFEKAVFESIKDKKVLKIQDSFVFVKTGHNAEDPDHPVQLATMLAAFEPLKVITSLIITHNRFNAEALKILVDSPMLSDIDYLHLGSNALGDEGAKIVASAPLFAKVHTLNLECNGIGPEGAKALATSKTLTEVTSLSMVDNRVGDEGALAIAQSDNLKNLTYLHLGGNRVKSEEAKQALRESPKLTQIKTLKVF